MPFVLMYRNPEIPIDTIKNAKSILREGIAEALSFDGGAMTPNDVRFFAHPKTELDETPWDIDITMMSNDVPERHNLEERLKPVGARLSELLLPKAISFGLWSNLHGPWSFVSSETLKKELT